MIPRDCPFCGKTYGDGYAQRRNKAAYIRHLEGHADDE